MGTRGILGFRVSGKDYLSYNHSDSYPEGLGNKVKEWVASWYPQDMESVRECVQEIRLVDKDSKPTLDDARALNRFTDLTVSRRSIDDWYCLLRKTQGQPQRMLAAGVMLDESSFMVHSRFCEWAYVVNFDEQVLEIYKGLQSEANSAGRYASMPAVDSEFFPVALQHTVKFEDLSRFDMETLAMQNYRGKHPELQTFREAWQEAEEQCALWFKDHEIKQTSETTWKCSKPGTWIYGFMVARIPSGWAIYGDIGDVLVIRSDDLDWLRGAANSPDYFFEKIPASTKTTEFYPGDALEALDDLASEGALAGVHASRIYETWCDDDEAAVHDGNGFIAAWRDEVGSTDVPYPFYMPLGVMRCVLAAKWFCARMPNELPVAPWRKEVTIL